MILWLINGNSDRQDGAHIQVEGNTDRNPLPGWFALYTNMHLQQRSRESWTCIYRWSSYTQPKLYMHIDTRRPHPYTGPQARRQVMHPEHARWKQTFSLDHASSVAAMWHANAWCKWLIPGKVVKSLHPCKRIRCGAVIFHFQLKVVYDHITPCFPVCSNIGKNTYFIFAGWICILNSLCNQI
jgi:hypothetical protein